MSCPVVMIANLTSTTSIYLPLDEFQGACSLLLVHQIEVVVARKQRCQSCRKVGVWRHNHLPLDAQHPRL